MLTRELLINRTTKGKIRPSFVSLSDAALNDLARDLADLAANAATEQRTLDELEAALRERSGAYPKPKIARGLEKLLLDKTEIEAPDEGAAEKRMAVFLEASKRLRALPDGAPLEDYLASQLDIAGAPEDRHALYADLPGRRRVLACDLGGPELLARYNLAQVQGLVLHARALEIETAAADILAVRRVLRWLKFCRLVAEVEKSGAGFTMRVDGPAAIFDVPKRYGLQLATFLPVIPVLPTFTLRAEIHLPRRQPAELILTEADGLVSPHDRALGHVPPEIEHVGRSFADDVWTLDLLPEPRHAGAKSVCVPDFTFRHRETGRTVYVELFHRWHRAALGRRLDDLETRPDPSLHLGVDRALLADEALRARIEGHPQVLVFNAFPTGAKLRAALDA